MPSCGSGRMRPIAADSRAPGLPSVPKGPIRPRFFPGKAKTGQGRAMLERLGATGLEGRETACAIPSHIEQRGELRSLLVALEEGGRRVRCGPLESGISATLGRILLALFPEHHADEPLITDERDARRVAPGLFCRVRCVVRTKNDLRAPVLLELLPQAPATTGAVNSVEPPVRTRKLHERGDMVQTKLEDEFAGLEVSITGRLASMTRDEALRRISAAGAEFVATPRGSTALLFVGRGGAPLGEDGRLTNSLRLAHDLQDQGSSIRIEPEEELLSMLGLEERSADFHRLYTTAQLARILDLPQTQIRSWVRHGLIEPVKLVRRLTYYDFRQVADAKALSRLTAEGVTTKRIKQSLAALGAWLPSPARSLAQLEALKEDGALVVRTDEGELAEATGQLRLDFEGGHAVPHSSDDQVSVPDTELWFQRGVRLEEKGRHEEAIVAYARALDPVNPRAEVAFSLGNALFLVERTGEASQCFDLATELDPEYLEAWNNLGNACVALERHDEAIAAFQRALALAPDYADAHFNLAETLAADGRLDEARKHWLAYLEEDPHSSWAQEVRARLRRTER